MIGPRGPTPQCERNIWMLTHLNFRFGESGTLLPLGSFQVGGVLVVGSVHTTSTLMCLFTMRGESPPYSPPFSFPSCTGVSFEPPPFFLSFDVDLGLDLAWVCLAGFRGGPSLFHLLMPDVGSKLERTTNRHKERNKVLKEAIFHFCMHISATTSWTS